MNYFKASHTLIERRLNDAKYRKHAVLCLSINTKLSDSDRGSNTEYTPTSYYMWNTRSHEQLLFIFPTKVSLTTIKVHYYSDRVRGRPRLRLYAVPDDIDVWNLLPISAPIFVGPDTSIPPGGEPKGVNTSHSNPSPNSKL